MSSDLLSALESIRLNDYISVAVVTVVVYDYILTLPNEIEYIWKRRWASVSSMFVLVRYVGLPWAISGALFGSTFVPGPASVSNALNLLYNWTFPVFIGTVDVMMILRVYAMYNQSKIILAILLTIYVWEMVSIIVIAGIYSNPNVMPVATVQLLDLSVCTVLNTRPRLQTYLTIPQFILGAMLCAFAIAQFLRQSFQMYKTTKQWHINSFIQLFVREGILYFFVDLFFNVIALINVQLTEIGTITTLDLIIGTTSFVLLYVLAPRFIVNVRVLYSQNVHSDTSQGIDAGFGISTPSGWGGGLSSSAGPPMEFVAARRDDEDIHGIEEIPMRGRQDLELIE